MAGAYPSYHSGVYPGHDIISLYWLTVYNFKCHFNFSAFCHYTHLKASTICLLALVLNRWTFTVDSWSISQLLSIPSVLHSTFRFKCELIKSILYYLSFSTRPEYLTYTKRWVYDDEVFKGVVCVSWVINEGPFVGWLRCSQCCCPEVPWKKASCNLTETLCALSPAARCWLQGDSRGMRIYPGLCQRRYGCASASMAPQIFTKSL